MRIGGSLVLIAVGAVLKWAVTYRTSGVNITTVGDILLVVGIVGLALSLVLLATRRRTDVIRERDVRGVDGAPGRAVSRTTYVEPSNVDAEL
jgi:beta-lactamase regulating signal transducer with metallopeptidase domain